jgi:hypothetical protein
VFGGEDIFLKGTGNKIATVKPNSTGGFDISTKGSTVRVRENVFGGQDLYENGKKIATSRPNGTGGIDIYQGNKKTLTCRTSKSGTVTCR